MRSSPTTVRTETTVLSAAGRRQLESRLDRSLKTLADLSERMSHGQPSEDDREEHRWLLHHVEQLSAVLQRAHDVNDVDEDPSVVELGDEVDVEFDDGTVGTYALVDPIETSSAEARISTASPLGRALVGSRPGKRVIVPAPAGAYGCVVRERRRLA